MWDPTCPSFTSCLIMRRFYKVGVLPLPDQTSPRRYPTRRRNGDAAAMLLLPRAMKIRITMPSNRRPRISIVQWKRVSWRVGRQHLRRAPELAKILPQKARTSESELGLSRVYTLIVGAYSARTWWKLTRRRNCWALAVVLTTHWNRGGVHPCRVNLLVLRASAILDFL